LCVRFNCLISPRLIVVEYKSPVTICTACAPLRPCVDGLGIIGRYSTVDMSTDCHSRT
jgi:hypothetical protein